MRTDGKQLKYARELRKNMTAQERRLWYGFLRSHRVKFYKQRPAGPYIVDFYAHRGKLVVELDGGQHYEAAGLARDRERDAYLSAHGLRVLRFSNLDVDRNFPGVCQAIDLALSQASPFGGGGTAKP